jgi:hypothetical protein
MERFLASALFRFLIFPLGNVFLGVAVKYVTRNDQYARFSKEDVAVGLDLIRTALLMYLMVLSDNSLTLLAASRTMQNASQMNLGELQRLQNQVQGLSSQVSMGGWIVLVFFLALWSTSTVVRKWGWASETELRPVRGIAVPLVMGVLALMFVMLGLGR